MGLTAVGGLFQEEDFADHDEDFGDDEDDDIPFDAHGRAVVK